MRLSKSGSYETLELVQEDRSKKAPPSVPSLEDASLPYGRGASVETQFIREAIVQFRGRGVRLDSPVRDASGAVDFARRVVRDHAREHFLALYLDGRHRPIAHSVLSVGTATAALVHPREVFQPAVLVGAVAILILHNHPSGDPSPSEEDRSLTKRLKDAGELLGIRLLDSVVWTHEQASYVSLRDEAPGDFA